VRFDCSELVAERKPGEWDDYLPTAYDESLIQLIHEHPESAARLIESLGCNSDDLLQQIQEDAPF
jgi:hypothetical protein